MKSYHNTVKETGETLEKYELSAQSQEKILLQMFTENIEMTASEAFKAFPGNSVILTSIRRGITNLYNQGKIMKTEKKKTGLYGRSEYVYRKFF